MRKFKVFILVIISFISPAILFAQQGSMAWTQATASANWSARSWHTSVVFDNKIWVIGGWASSSSYDNDVWYSTDGINWIQATANAGWSARRGHTSVVFNNKIWVIGGYDANGFFRNDVWYSSDGVTWSRATETAMWVERYGHSSVVFDNKMWVMGGSSGSGNRNDVWYSTDGVNWTCATYSATWLARSEHNSIVFDNKMWVMGGYSGSYRNDVWYSADGINWTQATANAGWSARDGHTSVINDNKIWVIGGSNSVSPYRMNDVWYSSEGVNWTQATANAVWSVRCRHTSVVFNNKMWVIGGYGTGSSMINDVWNTGGLGITLIYPNGVESLPSGSNQLIRWRSIGLGYAKYRLLFSSNGGSSYPDTIANNIAPNETSHLWHLPVLNINTVRLRIQMLDTTNTVILQDASDTNFTIQTTATIIQPNGGESWAGGTVKLIKWRTIGSDFARFRLLLSRNSGSTYIDTIAHNISATETTYSWIVPYSNLNTCRVMIQILDAIGSIIYQKASDTNFTIDSDPPSGFNLLSPPNGTLSNGNLSFAWSPASDNLGLSHYQLSISIPNDTLRIDSIFRTSTGYCANWIQATASAGWPARYSHTSVIFDNKIWVVGGTRASGSRNDVWYSTNGINWAQATANAGWLVRNEHTSVVFDNKMWVIGGWDDYSNKNDVWYSTNGVNWIQATANAGWTARRGHSSVVFDNKMWVMGGSSGSGNRNDVWYSTDGINWTRACSSAQWSGRYKHTSVVFDNKMWVIGGLNGSEVWYSTDGVNWFQATANAAWPGRSGHTSVVFDNKMWVIGGANYGPSYLHDVWYSTNGVNWTQATTSADWYVRNEHTSVVFDNKMWVIGGYGGSDRNDVWYSVSAGELLQIPEGLRTWFVRAFDRAGNWQRSTQTFVFSIDTSPPSTPILIAPVNNSCSQDTLPRFRWYQSIDNFSGVSYYQLQYATNSSFINGINVNVSDTTYQVPSRLADTTYYWRLKAVDSVGNSGDWCSVWSFEIDTRIPNVPILASPLNGIWLINTSVVFNWSQVSFDAKSPVRYILQVDTLTTFITPRIDTTNLVYDTLILTQARYFWRVRAYDLAGNQGAFSGRDSFGVDNSAPSVPNLVSPANSAVLTDSFVRFIWNRSIDNVSGVRNYQIQIANNSNFISPIDTLVSDSTIVRNLHDTTYYWRVKAIDRANNQSNWSSVRNFIVRTTGIEEINNLSIPTNFSLSLNSPNPFSRLTEIRYAIPFTTKVKIAVFSSTGEEIVTLTNSVQNQGWYSVRWNGKDSKGKLCPNGIYFYRLVTDEYQVTRKMLILR